MFFRFGSKSGKAVPPAGQALEEIHSQLQQQQQLWTEQLAHDPSCFAALSKRSISASASSPTRSSPASSLGLPTSPLCKTPRKKSNRDRTSLSFAPATLPPHPPARWPDPLGQHRLLRRRQPHRQRPWSGWLWPVPGVGCPGDSPRQDRGLGRSRGPTIRHAALL